MEETDRQFRITPLLYSCLNECLLTNYSFVSTFFLSETNVVVLRLQSLRSCRLPIEGSEGAGLPYEVLSTIGWSSKTRN